MASATSSLVAPAREALRACAAMQPSHWEPIDRVNAISSLTFRGRAPSPAGTSAALAALPGVASIEADSGLSPGAHRATDEFNHAAQTAHRLGYTGEGVGLAIMDTGQDSNCNGQNRPHRLYYPDGDPTKMTGRGIAGSRLERNLQLGAMPADDQLGHGTAVAALAAGAAWGAPGAHHGHAPGASIAGYAIAERPDGTSAVSTIISAWQAISADRLAYRLIGANNSYGGSPDPLSAAQRALDSAAFNADLLVTVCAYNTGLGGTPSSQSACNGLSVGAVTIDSHELTSYSARGPLHNDSLRTYPDLCAVSSTIGPNSDCEASAGPWFGTSFAAPQVLGAGALLRQATPSLTALETKAILLSSAIDLTEQNQGLSRNGLGVGLLRDDLALQTVLDPNRYTTVSLAQPGSVLVPIPVTAGEPTGVAITWHRKRFDLPDWTNVDLRVLDGSRVIAEGNSLRNLYEHVRFVPTSTGTYLAEISASSLITGPEQIALAVSLLGGTAMAGTYRSFGAPCAGSGLRPGSIIAGLNSAARPFDLIGDNYQLSATDWLFEFRAPAGGLQINGFEALVGLADAPATLTTSLHLDNLGLPAASSIASGTMEVGAQPGWNVTDFGTTISIGAGDRYYIGFRAPGIARFQVVLTGGDSIRAFQRWPCSGTFKPGGSAPAGFRILGGPPAPGLEPQLTGHAAPCIGLPFTTELRQAGPKSMAMLVTGMPSHSHLGIPLPLPLAVAGAPGCTLLTAVDHLVFSVTDTVGHSLATIQIPNDPALRNVKFRQQWFIVDPHVNALGMSSSQAAIARIGDR